MYHAHTVPLHLRECIASRTRFLLGILDVVVSTEEAVVGKVLVAAVAAVVVLPAASPEVISSSLMTGKSPTVVIGAVSCTRCIAKRQCRNSGWIRHAHHARFAVV